MSRRLDRGWQHTSRLARAFLNARQRELLWRMLTFSRALPHRFEQPLPAMMAQLTPASKSRATVHPDDIRRLADAVAAWHLHSPLGICLRRSLLRYYFLREAGLPVRIVFGARLKSADDGGGIGGHAWLTLNGNPYCEQPGDYEGFVQMYVYPEIGINN